MTDGIFCLGGVALKVVTRGICLTECTDVSDEPPASAFNCFLKLAQ